MHQNTLLLLSLLCLLSTTTKITANTITTTNNNNLRSQILTNIQQTTTISPDYTKDCNNGPCKFKLQNTNEIYQAFKDGTVCHIANENILYVCFGGASFFPNTWNYYSTMPSNLKYDVNNPKQCTSCDFQYNGVKYFYDISRVCRYPTLDVNGVQTDAMYNLCKINQDPITILSSWPSQFAGALVTANEHFCGGCTYALETQIYFYDENQNYCYIDDFTTFLACYGGYNGEPDLPPWRKFTFYTVPSYLYHGDPKSCKRTCDFYAENTLTMYRKHSKGVCKYAHAEHWQMCNAGNGYANNGRIYMFYKWPVSSWAGPSASSVPLCSGCSFGIDKIPQNWNLASVTPVDIGGYKWFQYFPLASVFFPGFDSSTTDHGIVACAWRDHIALTGCTPEMDIDYPMRTSAYFSLPPFVLSAYCSCGPPAGSTYGVPTPNPTIFSLNYYSGPPHYITCHWVTSNDVYNCGDGWKTQNKLPAIPFHTNQGTSNDDIPNCYCPNRNAFTDFFTGIWNGVEESYHNTVDDVVDWTTKVGNEFAKLGTNVGDYFQDDFVNDLKKVGDEIVDLVEDVCKVPGTKLMAKLACATALKLGVCIATDGQAPGCVSASNAFGPIGLALFKNALHCGAYEALRATKLVCDGVSDSIADTLVNAFPDAQYDIPCNAAIECLCGSCPFTCDYDDRIVCKAETYTKFFNYVQGNGET
jgi:hypothetical protein